MFELFSFLRDVFCNLVSVVQFKLGFIRNVENLEKQYILKIVFFYFSEIYMHSSEYIWSFNDFYFLAEIHILVKSKMKCLSNLMIDNIDSIPFYMHIELTCVICLMI